MFVRSRISVTWGSDGYPRMDIRLLKVDQASLSRELPLYLETRRQWLFRSLCCVTFPPIFKVLVPIRIIVQKDELLGFQRIRHSVLRGFSDLQSKSQSLLCLIFSSLLIHVVCIPKSLRRFTDLLIGNQCLFQNDLCLGLSFVLGLQMRGYCGWCFLFALESSLWRCLWKAKDLNVLATSVGEYSVPSESSRPSSCAIFSSVLASVKVIYSQPEIVVLSRCRSQ